MKYKRENGKIVKIADTATEARAEQSRRIGLPAPGAVDRAMEKGGKALAEGGARLAKAGMLGPVSKAPIVSDAVDAVKGTVKKGMKALSDIREENKRRGPTNPEWMKSISGPALSPITKTMGVLSDEVGIGAPYKYQHTPPSPNGPTGGAKVSTTKTTQKEMKK